MLLGYTLGVEYQRRQSPVRREMRVNRLLQSEPADGSDAGLAFGSTQPMTAVRSSAELAHSRRHAPTYHPTRSPAINRALEMVDRVVPGKAGFVQRLFSYLFVGGFAAVINLIVFTIMYYKVPLPFNDESAAGHTAHYLSAFVVATEISILANFIPNDYFTFRHLPGHQRSWLVRGLRFHITCIAGTLLTLAISFSLHLVSIHWHVALLNATVSQGIALIVVTAFNFTVHHIFTYRHVRHAAG